MRQLVLPALALSLSACDLFGGGVGAAVVQSVQVERLDLDRPWDNPWTHDLPDIYVDIYDDTQASFDFRPDFRSDVRENVAALPLTYRTSGTYAIRLDAVVSLSVNDRDVVGDDLMFASGTFPLADHYQGEERGAFSRIELENEDGRVVLFVRWD